MTHRLVADIGGTNSRIAVYSEETGILNNLRTFKNRDFGSFEAVLERWYDQHRGDAPERGCIAVAAPPGGDIVEMINIDWRFSCAALAEHFGLRELARINDFEANAHALPYLQANEAVCLHPGAPAVTDKLATVGPGTGLGGATLQNMGGAWYANACEPGHIGLSPGNGRELALFEFLLQEHREVYAELLVSGQGLLNLYRALAQLDGRQHRASQPADVTSGALKGDDWSVEALEMFCGLLGSVCGDFVLANGAYGGLYLAGGIVPRILPFLRSSSFHRRMLNKGVMGDHLSQVPVYSITAPHPALLGAAHLPM